MDSKSKFPKRHQLPIGYSDFESVITQGFRFVDKSFFIKEVITAPAEIILLPRPRRFGKTLNLSMLRYFFEKADEDRACLFDGLLISEEEDFKIHQGKYPLIYMTFKDLKALSWSDCLAGIKRVICEAFSQHHYLIESDTLLANEKKGFEKILYKEAEKADYEDSLRNLSEYLNRFYQHKIIILIDEYDTPIHAGYASGYYREIISFLRNFLSGGLKDNPHLFKGVLTGILRVAKESVFSGLNNLGVYTLLDTPFNTCFGFTEAEIQELLKIYNKTDKYDEVSHWYNGYLFGGEVIYNPWSIVNYLERNEDWPKPYWVNTADTSMIDRLATREGRELKEEIAQLLEGRSIIKPLYDSIVMRDLETHEELLWSFLVFSGYLKPLERVGEQNWKLIVPNQEVHTIYREMIRFWFGGKTRASEIEEMQKSLEQGDATLFEIMLKKIVKQVMSFHDLAGEPEKVYHALVLGMLVWMSYAYDIRSNRESGYGRYDVMLKPKGVGKPGVVIEFKRVDEAGEDGPEITLQSALDQIERRQYGAELEASGIKDILKIAVAFRGKELWVRSERRGVSEP
jgi:hypothetical protein